MLILTNGFLCYGNKNLDANICEQKRNISNTEIFFDYILQKMIRAVFYASELSLKKPQLISRNQNFSSVP